MGRAIDAVLFRSMTWGHAMGADHVARRKMLEFANHFDAGGICRTTASTQGHEVSPQIRPPDGPMIMRPLGQPRNQLWAHGGQGQRRHTGAAILAGHRPVPPHSKRRA